MKHLQLKCLGVYILILIYYITHFRYGGNAKVVHFLGKTKPWSYTFDPKAKQITGSTHEATTHPTFLLDWWTLYSRAVVPMLQEQCGEKPFHSGCAEVGEHVLLDLQPCIYTANNLLYQFIQTDNWHIAGKSSKEYII